MVQPRSPDGGTRGGGGFNPRPPTSGGKGPTPGAISGAAITSAGSLSGGANALLFPFVTFTGTSYMAVFDPTDFNCEEDCVYQFKEEDGLDAQGQPSICLAQTINRVLIQYRNIGKVSFFVQIKVYSPDDDTFRFINSALVKVGTNPPDNKIHTVKVDIVATGERPQLIIVRRALQGPLSIIKTKMLGASDEEDVI